MKSAPILAVSILSASTSAQPTGSAAWVWNVTTQDGDAIVEPGESATVTLSMLMTPDDPEMLTYFAAATFDTLGDAGAASGNITTWEILNSLDNLLGDLTTTDGVSLYGTVAGQLARIGPFSEDNPIDVLTFGWAPDDYSPSTVEYHTASESTYTGQSGFIDVWSAPDVPDLEVVQWPVEEAMVSFQVVPAPPVAFALLVSLFVRCRR